MHTQIIPVKSNIIFQFVEDTTSTRFVNSTQSGLLVSSQDAQQSQLPRWGKVTHVGDQVREVKPGDFALIEHGMWTPGFYVDGQRYWKTDEEKVMAISDEPTTTY